MNHQHCIMSNNKTKILSKSLELFEQYGYQKTTLTDIANSVGKVKTAIYYYFSGKEEIFGSLVKSEAEDFNKKLFTAVQKVNDPIEKIEVYVAKRIQLMQDLAKRYHFLKKEFFQLMGIVEQNRIVSDIKEIAYVSAIFEEGIRQQKMAVEDVEFAAKILVNTLKGLEIQMYVTDQIVVSKKDLPNFIHFLLYGIITKN